MRIPSRIYRGSIFTTCIAIALLISSSTAQQCSAGNLCPESAPCCSEFGFCGTGSANCLGGCNPGFSHTPNSCMPEPMCSSGNYTFSDLKRFVNSTTYNGDATSYDFTISGGVPLIQDGSLVLTLSEANQGTRIASTHYVYYGTISATMQISGGTGVVSAFITMSDIHDEIDWEFLGYTPTEGNTNYYYEGIADYTNGGKSNISSDATANFHTYTIDWQEDQLNWLIDGQVVRTVKKSDTFNATTNIYSYPSTPSRFELSIWPGGASTNAPGTIQWAGGPISYQSPPMPSVGYYSAIVQSISVLCASIPTGANVTSQSPNAYVYSSLPNSIAIVNAQTKLSSNASTGANPSASGTGVHSQQTGSAAGAQADAQQGEASSSSLPPSFGLFTLSVSSATTIAAPLTFALLAGALALL